jgi:hypothetical protein
MEAHLISRICVRTATRLSPFEIIYGRAPVLPSERMLASRYKIQVEGPSAESENDQQALHEQALTELIEVRRLNVLLRATHQANLRATAAANRDISQMRAEAAFQKRQHRGVYRVTNLVPGQLVIMRKPKREHKLDSGWEGYHFRAFYDEAGQIAVCPRGQQQIALDAPNCAFAPLPAAGSGSRVDRPPAESSYAPRC